MPTLPPLGPSVVDVLPAFPNLGPLVVAVPYHDGRLEVIPQAPCCYSPRAPHTGGQAHCWWGVGVVPWSAITTQAEPLVLSSGGGWPADTHGGFMTPTAPGVPTGPLLLIALPMVGLLPGHLFHTPRWLLALPLDTFTTGFDLLHTDTFYICFLLFRMLQFLAPHAFPHGSCIFSNHGRCHTPPAGHSPPPLPRTFPLPSPNSRIAQAWLAVHCHHTPFAAPYAPHAFFFSACTLAAAPFVHPFGTTCTMPCPAGCCLPAPSPFRCLVRDIRCYRALFAVSLSAPTPCAFDSDYLPTLLKQSRHR